MTHSMFAVDGAGLMLADEAHHLRSVAASDDRFAHLDDLQRSRARPTGQNAPPCPSPSWKTPPPCGSRWLPAPAP